MPRRKALSEKKRERLVQEHAQLQRLMLEARSSVRRSSLKEETVVESRLQPLPEEVAEPLREPNESTTDFYEAEEKPLRETELFQKPISAAEPEIDQTHFSDSSTGNRNDLAQKNKTVNVILPDENAAAPLVATTIGSDVPTSSRYAEIETHDVVAERPAASFSDTYDDPDVAPKKNHSKAYLITVIAALLLGFGGYYLYTKTPKKVPVVVRQPAEPSVSKPEKRVAETTAPVQRSQTDKTNGAEPKTGETATSVAAGKQEKPVVNKPAVAKEEPAITPKTAGTYKVIMKAYFHDMPDESTRRKAFIIHWNNAVLTPLDEKGGFVYVVFTNHLGQTSKGWLRKSDLRRIK